MAQTHLELLEKFERLSGVILTSKEIKHVPADSYVSTQHIMHDLIRGFYKPAQKPYLLSTLLSEDVYGKEIVWLNENKDEFIRIEMKPPSGEKDNRKKSDIAAARYNMNNKIPLGILVRVEKGKNKILGLGIIIEEKENGNFVVAPYNLRVSK